MKTVLLTVSLLLFGSAAALATIDRTPCLDVHVEARRVSDGLYKVTAYGRWRCDAKLLGAAYMKTSVQGQPAGQAIPFPGAASQSAYVAGELPLTVCVDVEGRNRDGGLEIAARQCVSVDHLTVDLPKPVLQPRGLQVWSR